MPSKTVISVLIFILSFLGFIFYPDTWGPPELPSNPRPEEVIPDPSELILEDNIKVASWNLLNFGASKNSLEIAYIASTIADFDVVAIQEVSTSSHGPKAVGRLLDQLNRMGSKWDAIHSNATSGEGTERYAFFWKPSKLRRSGRAWLVKPLEAELDREPFMCRFETKDGNEFLLANFHAIPSAKNPEREIRKLKQLNELYSEDQLVILGDFNVEEYREAFEPLKQEGFHAVLKDQKTSLKRKLDGNEYLSKAHDNIFIESEFLYSTSSGVIDFVPEFESLKEAASVSDHLPVWTSLSWILKDLP